ncbi:MAG: hypothetical protein XXXJIFNMEKO3_02426 [Candidatus Erwinia impunctatus]|nr:hypothetical protein XXXJIFNMEKO_02426 [Culicoides impunctatus]
MKWHCPTCSAEGVQEQKVCHRCESRTGHRIGGLLYLPLVILLMTLYVFGCSLLGNITIIQRYYQQMNSDFRIYFVIITVVNVLFIGYAVTLVSLFLKKKSTVPFLSILIIFLVLVSVLCDVLITNSLFGDVLLTYESLKPVFKMIIVAVVWTSYFLLSARVKITFIR